MTEAAKRSRFRIRIGTKSPISRNAKKAVRKDGLVFFVVHGGARRDPEQINGGRAAPLAKQIRDFGKLINKRKD
jgi:hypothetical protein